MEKRIFKIIIVLALFLTVVRPVEAGNFQTMYQEFIFTETSQINTPIVARPGAYDSGPTAIEENGITKVWYCGGGLQSEADYLGHDSVFYASFDANGNVIDSPRRVIAPSLNDTSVDGDHACAVTVVKQSHPAIDSGKEKYQMFYECAPKMHRREDGLNQGCYTEICHAVSDDGINWQRYNENIWGSQYRFANANEPPTSIIGLNKTWAGSSIVAGKGISQNIGLEIDGSGKRTANFSGDKTCGDLGTNYGTGHPTAIVVPTANGDQQIWMWYYDSQGNTDNRAIYLTKSWDGMHFETPVKTTLQSPNKIKYVNVQVGTHNGFYVSSGAPFLMNIFNYSWDGINWFWSDQGDISFYTDYLKNNFNLGSVTGCVTGSGGIVGDKYGYIKSLDISVLSQEGFFGIDDNGLVINEGKCYSDKEVVSRGSTWDLYLMKGKLVPKTMGDATGDGKVTLADFMVWRKEFLNGTGIKADFNNDKKVSLIDFGIWRREFLKSL